MKKIICSWIFLLLASGSLWSCGNTETAEIKSEANTVSQTEEAVETEYAPVAEDFSGATFTILHPSERYYDIAEESTGEIVNDAIFERDSLVAEMFNISFRHEQESDAHAVRHIYNDKIRGVVMANDPAFDIIYGIESCTTETFTEGLYHNLLNFDEIDLEEIWWCPGQTDLFAIHGKQFGGFGLSTMDFYKESTVIFYNETIINDYTLSDPTVLVIEGNWTLDQFMNMTVAATHDIDGDGKYTLGTDTLGYIARWTNNCSWQTGLGISVLEKDENDNYIVIHPDDRTAEIIGVMSNFVNCNQGSMKIQNDKEAEFGNAFMQDKALFYCERLKTSETLRDMSSDFGVLPFPKYDMNQEDYYSQAATATTMILFPLSVANPHMSAMVSEALSFYGYELVVPKYYESALKDKYMRKESTSEVMEIIFANTVNNLDYAFTGVIGGSTWTNQLFQSCGFEKKNYASTIAANKSTWETNLTKLYEAFAALDN